MPNTNTSPIDRQLRSLLADVLGLPASRAAAFTDATPLLGALPELDSMAIAGLFAELEDRLGIRIEDEDVDGSLFETFGSLLSFAERKRQG